MGLKQCLARIHQWLRVIAMWKCYIPSHTIRDGFAVVFSLHWRRPLCWQRNERRQPISSPTIRQFVGHARGREPRHVTVCVRGGNTSTPLSVLSASRPAYDHRSGQIENAHTVHDIFSVPLVVVFFTHSGGRWISLFIKSKSHPGVTSERLNIEW